MKDSLSNKNESNVYQREIWYPVHSCCMDYAISMMSLSKKFMSCLEDLSEYARMVFLSTLREVFPICL